MIKLNDAMRHLLKRTLGLCLGALFLVLGLGFPQVQPESIVLAAENAINQTLNLTIGTLPAGKNVVLTFDVTVGSLPPGTTQISNQGQVSGGNFATTLTDDPAQPGASDPTIIAAQAGSVTSFPFVISSDENGNIRGMAYRDEDIIVFTPATNSWSLVFDGSDVGLGNVDVDGFGFLPNGHLLLSVDKDFTLNNFGAVDESDILEFTALEWGGNTRGSYGWYFDGSDVGLDKSDEDVDAIDFDKDGNLVISVTGAFSAPGVSSTVKGNDEDLFVLKNATLNGATTMGKWELYFDGSDVGLTSSGEDIGALWADHANQKLYFATHDDYSLPGGLKGNEDDVVVCTYTTLGANTACTFARVWNGDRDHDFDDDAIDGLSIGPVPPVPANQAVNAASAPVDDTVEYAGDDVDEPDELDGHETVEETEAQNTIFLPLVNR